MKPISTSEAAEIIHRETKILGTESIPFGEAAGRILRTSIEADRDLPPFDRVMMDGIIFPYESWEEGLSEFRVAGVQAAGDPPIEPMAPGSCLEIMTGAVAPPGCDCMIPYEEVEISDRGARVKPEFEACRGRFIHRRGSNHPAGTALIAPGTRLTAREIAVAASCGYVNLEVTRMPAVTILSTGDELVEVHEPVAPQQIRHSNTHALRAALEGVGISGSVVIHLRDDPRVIESALSEILPKSDVVILSGGVSKGKFDYVPGALKNLGVNMLFHGVRQRPGKPFWFGSKNGQTSVFALPGNPLSTLTCFHRYGIPALDKMLGLPALPAYRVVLSEAFTFPPFLTCFLPVSLTLSEAGLLRAKPRLPSNSGDFVSIVKSDGFVELPGEDRNDFPEGTTTSFFRWV